MSSSRKRKHQPRHPVPYRNTSESTSTYIPSSTPSAPAPVPALRPSSRDPSHFVQIHEADIVRGPSAHLAALSLEVEVGLEPGSGLIRWGWGETGNFVGGFDADEDEDEDGDGGNTKTKGKGKAIDEGNKGNWNDSGSKSFWVDRYDARLLLDPPAPPRGPEHTDTDTTTRNSTTTTTTTLSTTPDSPTGWSDLPSDTEDTFFFTPDEVDDYRREKRRRVLNQAREDRLRGRMAEDGDAGDGDGDVWGESDEEPSDSLKEIMHKTAKSILTSPNPAQLEMRILANHGSDKRFAFLRGRWSRSWRTVKARVRVEMEEKEKKGKEKEVGLGVLADYGDSDVEEEEEGDEIDAEAAAILARRKKLEIWKAQRKQVK